MFQKLLDLCHDSETILWSRAKMFIGVALWTIQESGVDLSVIMSPKWLIVYKIGATFLIAEGFMSERLRRRRATDLNPLEPEEPSA